MRGYHRGLLLMSREALHISKSEAIYAAVSGVLVGVSPAAPILGGVGLVVATVGALRYKSRERDHQLEQLSEYLYPADSGTIYQARRDIDDGSHKI